MFYASRWAQGVIAQQERASMETPAKRGARRLVAAASLIAGPLLMTIGDLFHPEERMDPAAQIAILANDASRWYLAHLLLFIGMLVSIPGFFALASLTAERKPAAGHAARILISIGAAAFASVFVGEMLIGRFVIDGATASAATGLLQTMFSGPIAAPMIPAMLAFFVGTAFFAVPLVGADRNLRWTAGLYSAGLLLVLAEILSAQVLLSQIGNAVILCGGTIAAATTLRRGTGTNLV
jgi:hypothetical protein